MILIVRSNGICTSIVKSKFVVGLMKPRKMFWMGTENGQKLRAFQKLLSPQVTSRLPLVLNRDFFYPASFQTRKWPRKADVKVELHTSVFIWVESIP